MLSLSCKKIEDVIFFFSNPGYSEFETGLTHKDNTGPNIKEESRYFLWNLVALWCK